MTARRLAFGIILLSGLFLACGSASAQVAPPSQSLEALLPGQGASISGRILQLFLLISVLSIAPGLVIMVTSFTRFIIALSFLRVGLGLQTTPANMILLSLALFLTLFVMAPTFSTAYEKGLQPLLDNKISEKEAYTEATAPFREFMKKNVRPKDLQLFADIAVETMKLAPADTQDDLRVLIPAFMISEIRRGFEIGFLIIIPFLVIDLIVATITMSMGMMMMPPTVISVPFKILFFVLMDGWNLLMGSLVRSYL